MRERKLAHVSDLHLGHGERITHAAEELCEALCTWDVDHVIVTGDITQNGRASEVERFEEIFAPLLESGRMTVVPGNHDRRNDDVRDALMPGERVQVERREGLHIVRLDSTGEHNRRFALGHGRITERDIEDAVDALSEAPAGTLAILCLHHHPLPLPEDELNEKITNFLGLPLARELARGQKLVERALGVADLVLFGHRHRPAALTPFPDHDRPLGVFNAGCTTRERRARIFRHRDGTLLAPPEWSHVMPGSFVRDVVTAATDRLCDAFDALAYPPQPLPAPVPIDVLR